jgi:hypothetical protein
MKKLKIKKVGEGMFRVKWGKLPVMIVQPIAHAALGLLPSAASIREAIESHSSPGDKPLPEFEPVFHS